MKVFSFLPLVKASYTKNKVRSMVFVLFIAFCVACILLTVSVILPMWDNMENKVNNHPYNREITSVVSVNDTKTPQKLAEIDHVVEVKRSTGYINATNTGGEIMNPLAMSYLHNNYSPVITNGEMFDSNDENVAILPEIIHDIDPQTQARVDINCKDFIGKELEFCDDYGNSYKFKIVGTYDITDPALNTETIFIPYNQMVAISDTLPNDDGEVLYSVIVDHYRNREAVLEKCMEFSDSYFGNDFNIDLNSFNMSLIVLLVVLLVFLIMVVIGTVIFVSSCIKGRTNELALYRSLGYKPNHIFTIIFTEYFIMLLVGFILAVGISLVLAQIVINPYLSSSVGEGIMSMQVQLNAVNILTVFVVFIAIIVIVCINATKRTGKIQLAVLLKER